jgi:ABC-type nitrate/sulfonate/bicarbonate transport system substrate-binding protein
MVSRRRFFQLTLTTAAGLALAACGGSAPAPAQSASSAGSAAASPSASGKPAAQRKLVVASTTAAGSQTPLWLAENLHAWDSRGLTVQRQRLAPDIGTKALLTKEIDVLIQSPSAVIPAVLNGNVELVYVGSIFNRSQFAMAAKPAIKTAADLRGKMVATDRPGTTTDFHARVLFPKLGLKFEDVQLVGIGSSDAIFAALMAGKVDAGPIAIPQTFQAQAAGFNILATTYDIKYQNIGPVVQKARVEELTPALIPFLQGVRDGIRAFNSQPDLAKKLIEENTKESDQTVLQKTYDFYTKETQFQEDLEPTMDGIQSMIDFLGETALPEAKGAKAERFVDRRVLDKVPKS